MMCVDDDVFAFGSRSIAETGINLIMTHFDNFELEMHVGNTQTASKTDFVFPHPQDILN